MFLKKSNANEILGVKDYTKEKHLVIPDCVTNIDNVAFWDCTSLESITISNGITHIGNCTFWDCTSLKSITIPNSIAYIGNWAFWRCDNLKSISISRKTNVSKYTFDNCPAEIIWRENK